MSSENQTLSSQPDLQALYPSLKSEQQQDLPVLQTKQDIISFSAKQDDSHANRLDKGFAIFSGSIGAVGEVIAVMGKDACEWLGSQTKTTNQRGQDEWKEVSERYPSIKEEHKDVLAHEGDIEEFEKRFEGSKVAKLDQGWAVFSRDSKVLAVLDGEMCAKWNEKS